MTWLEVKACIGVFAFFMVVVMVLTKALFGRWWPPPGWDEL
jgi:hypothetical protein